MAVNETVVRDYALTGPEASRARERGLADGSWWQPSIEPGVLAALTVRTDARAAADVLGWLILLVASAVGVVLAWGTWWVVPAMVVYGALYAGAADARWHECGHGTAFRTDRWNDVVYPFASFLLFREPTVWRWSHVRHHSDTIIVGRDAEIAFPRPPRFALIAANCFNLVNGPRAIARMARHARGRIDPDVADYVPADEHRRVFVEARVFLAVLIGVIVVALATWSLLPLVLVGLPTFYGVWLVVFFGMTQHAGLAEDVLDHRRNTRTVHMNPVFRFLYLNMNHHTEHHLFPTVPYHRLPALHRELSDQLAPALPSTWAAYREILPTLWRQRRDPTHQISPDIPAPAGGGPIAEMPLAGGTDLEVGEIRRVEIDGRPVIVCRPGPDEYVIADPICTHGDAELADGLLSGWILECPRHNGRFDLRTGEAVRRPAREPLEVRPARLVEGTVSPIMDP